MLPQLIVDQATKHLSKKDAEFAAVAGISLGVVIIVGLIVYAKVFH